MKQRTIFAAIVMTMASITATTSMARESIEVVGSSTVYPFSTVVAERYGRASGKATPQNRVNRFGRWHEAFLLWCWH